MFSHCRIIQIAATCRSLKLQKLAVPMFSYRTKARAQKNKTPCVNVSGMIKKLAGQIKMSDERSKNECYVRKSEVRGISDNRSEIFNDMNQIICEQSLGYAKKADESDKKADERYEKADESDVQAKKSSTSLEEQLLVYAKNANERDKKAKERAKKADERSKEIKEQLLSLIGYSNKRDAELKILVRDTFVDELESAGYTVDILNITEILRADGLVAHEWDGILYVSGKSGELPIFFFLESKQNFNKRKFSKFKKRLASTNKTLKSLDPELKVSKEYPKVSKRYLRGARFLSNLTGKGPYLVLGVVGSPHFKHGVNKDVLESENISYVTLSSMQYIAKIAALRTD